MTILSMVVIGRWLLVDDLLINKNNTTYTLDSPDPNPIEHCWAWLKKKIRDAVHKFETLDELVKMKIFFQNMTYILMILMELRNEYHFYVFHKNCEEVEALNQEIAYRNYCEAMTMSREAQEDFLAMYQASTKRYQLAMNYTKQLQWWKIHH